MRDDFYRDAQGYRVSSLGIGSYLGSMDDSTDAAYTDAVRAAVDNGINFIDTSLNYRHQRSERAIGAALKDLDRGRVVVCTKAGYLIPDAVPAGLKEVVGRQHTIEPAFLEDQLNRSLKNLGVAAVDVFYLHNPESQLQHVTGEEFYTRVERSFAKCEEMAAAGKLRYYGTATWSGYRGSGLPGSLSLTRLESIARKVGGERHRFRFIQLPFNVTMTEAFTQKAEEIGGSPVSVLDAAAALGITVVASASLLQARLAKELPEAIAKFMPDLNRDASRAIQFARSAPGMTVALAGMSQRQHVLENIEVAGAAPLKPEMFAALIA